MAKKPAKSRQKEAVPSGTGPRFTKHFAITKTEREQQQSKKQKIFFLKLYMRRKARSNKLCRPPPTK